LTYNIARIKHGLQDRIVVGNLDSKRDWGYAKEYVEAMWLMLQLTEPDDYVIATNETHSVREFVEYAFRYVGVDVIWNGKGLEEKGFDKKTGQTLVEVSDEFFRPAEVDILMGDYSKAKEKLGWQPKVKFEELARIMVEADMKRVEALEEPL
jgi:GDPmannose 4,6-dehydratase